jgi:catechol 2,3-dioxygenase-like lactoylglutathione lyase family enzyme
MFKLKKVSEIVFITANLEQLVALFCDYGGWTIVIKNEFSDRKEALLQFIEVPFGRLRIIELKGIVQKIMRPASKLWDTGGILDIDIRSNNIWESYQDLTDRGWSAAAEPMPLPVDDFVLDECLMTNADGIMIALAQRHSPPLELPKDKKLASHIYLSAMTVQNLEIGTDFFVNKLGFSLVNDTLKVKFPAYSPNNFGVPHNFSDKFEINLSIYSPDGTRDTMVECIESKGLRGNDFSGRCEFPNRGIYCYRIEVESIENYQNFVKNNTVKTSDLQNESWSGIGSVKTFSVKSPDGATIVFFEKI